MARAHTHTRITPRSRRSYAALAGDDNPVHLDAGFAAGTRFGGRIVHGMLYGSLFGTLFGAQIPGSIYVSQRMAFRRPVYVGETVTARIDVTRVVARGTGEGGVTLVTCVTTVRRGGGGGGGLVSYGEAPTRLRQQQSQRLGDTPGNAALVATDSGGSSSSSGNGGGELCLDGEAVVILPGALR